ncbi:hypothetical protein V8E55_003380 [Tylopilus felleus]
MSFCLICFFHKFRRSQHSADPEQQHHPNLPSADLATELEDSRKFSLNSLTTLLPILAVSVSKELQPVVLALLIYTISLRLAMNACFHQNYPIVSRCLHAIPLLGMSCMAGVELVSRVQSPVLAAVGMLLGVFPLVTIVIHHGRHCADTSVV